MINKIRRTPFGVVIPTEENRFIKEMEIYLNIKSKT